MELLIIRISYVNRNTSTFGSSGSYLMESPNNTSTGIIRVTLNMGRSSVRDKLFELISNLSR